MFSSSQLLRKKEIDSIVCFENKENIDFEGKKKKEGSHELEVRKIDNSLRNRSRKIVFDEIAV